MTTALADLLDALGAAPSLPGARCRGRSHLFGPVDLARQLVAAVDEARKGGVPDAAR